MIYRTEKGRFYNEGPQHKVTFAQPFAVSKFEVTFSEWDACVANKGCNHKPRDKEGWGRGPRPVINVSWYHAQEYIAWISRKTGEKYRLLTEAEWEYAARAGTKTTYSWGDEVGKNNANCWDCKWDKWNRGETSPVGSFKPNAFGLYDMHGNVWEWVHDPWHDTYRGAPTDGTAWMKANDGYFRVLRGGSWADSVRAAFRIQGAKDDKYEFVGFRVARRLEP